jgi:ketosteroid isomerase-like protein
MTEATEHPNATLMREFFAAFGPPDVGRLRELTSPDLVWVFPGTSAIAGEYHGIDEVLGGIRHVAMTLGQGKNGFELLEVYANDHSAVTVHRDFYQGDDNSLDLRYVLYVRIADGRITEIHEIPFDQAENDRYYAVQTASYVRATS